MTVVTVPRPGHSSIPDLPGAYLFRDADGRVVYVGKARSLRKRLASTGASRCTPGRGDDGGGRVRRVDRRLHARSTP